MATHDTRKTSRQAGEAPGAQPVTIQVPFPVLGIVNGVREALHGLCIATALQVLETMMEADREVLCGPGAAGEFRMGGGDRPAGRAHDGAGCRGGVDAAVREHAGPGAGGRVGAGDVAQRGVAAIRGPVDATLHAFLARPLGELDVRVVCIDGKVFRDHCMVVALGIDTEGRKHVLGLREGATETAAVAGGLLSDLVTWGLPTDRTLLFVVDGAGGLRRAVTDVFGSRGVVQRCQLHK